MNRQEAKKLLPIIKAFSEGKVVQQKCAESWVKVDEDCDFHFPADTYRIKSEPKYRPFANAEECLKAIQKHQLVLKCKECLIPTKDVYLTIVRIKTDGIETDVERLGFSDAMGLYTFADGTPFGILNN